MAYLVKEIFYTLQGEGANAGRPAVFCRFSGCNLWSGRSQDREHAICQFCDTDFVGINGTEGGRYEDAASLVSTLQNQWPKGFRDVQPFVVLTGGEPLLQVDEELILHLKARNFLIAVETNGTVDVPAGVDWVCVSPKAGAPLKVKSGNELKVVYPQFKMDYLALEELNFENFFIQPKDVPDQVQNLQESIKFCLTHPRWRLSLQTHKILGVR